MSELSDILGKVPPQAVEIEEAVLGAIMLESDSIHGVAARLKPEHFYKSAHESIYNAIIDLYRDSEPIDSLTVTNQLKKRQELELAGGPYAIAQLTDKINSAAHLESHANIIVENWMKREAIKISSELHNEAYDETKDPFSVLDKGMSSMMHTVESVTKGKAKSWEELLDKNLDDTQQRMLSEDALVGLSTGLVNLDKHTGGLQGPDLIVLAARPGMGKTALAIQIAEYVSRTDPVGVFSLEMSDDQLTTRIVSNVAEIESDKILKGTIQEYEFERQMHISGNLKKNKLHIDDTGGINLIELTAKINILKHKYGVKLIVIDYLQLMSIDGNNRDQEIGKVTRAIKSIAKNLNIPIILLSQLSRKVEDRGGDKRPRLSDLRESGNIEQDADMVWFIYRPEYYGIDADEEGNSLQGRAELNIAKYRQGSIGTVDLRFIGKFTKFKDYIPDASEPTESIKFDNELLEETPPF